MLPRRHTACQQAEPQCLPCGSALKTDGLAPSSIVPGSVLLTGVAAPRDSRITSLDGRAHRGGVRGGSPWVCGAADLHKCDLSYWFGDIWGHALERARNALSCLLAAVRRRCCTLDLYCLRHWRHGGHARALHRGGPGSTGPNRSSWSIRDRSIPVSFALIAAHHAGSFHHTGPWYIVFPLLVVGIGLAIWRRRRWGGGRGLFGGSGDQ
jgi:hypothetical protein